MTPLAARTLPALVRASGTHHADREAVVDGDVRLSFADLAARVTGFARALMAAGVQPGDRVALWAPNGWRWLVAALGTVSAGAVLVPLNTRFKGPEAGYILGRSRARLLVIDDGFLGNPGRVNVHGGAIAVGHPFGMTGARIATTLLNGLVHQDRQFGLETMCTAGGQGMAMILERL